MDEKKSARLAELHEQIVAGAAELVSSEGWQAMLAVAARLHSYSLNNVLLIAAQNPQATQVAGFNRWRSLGRQVRRGEKGIAILAPCTYRASAKGDAAPPAEAGEPTGPTTPERGPARLRGFRVAHVFDVSQTDGEPLPDVRPTLLAGEAPAGLWDFLAAQVEAHGYQLQRGGCGGANGYTDPYTGVVRVRDDVSDAQAVKTLAHELGHVVLGHVADLATYLVCRGRCEVEAESVAFVVVAAWGLDATDYTVRYVTGWAGGDVAQLRASAAAVISGAHRILEATPAAAEPERAELVGAAAAG